MDERRDEAGGTRRRQGRTRLSSAKSEATLRRLLSGGREAMQHTGFHGTSIRDIVKSAGVSRATFYLYFDEKIDFLRALAVQSLAETRSKTISPPAYQPGPEGVAAVRRWLDVVYDVHQEYAAVWAAIEAERANDPVLLLLDVTRNAEARERYVSILRDSPGAARTDPESLALAMSAIVERIWQGIAEERAPVPRQLDTIAVFVYEAIYGGRALAG